MKVLKGEKISGILHTGQQSVDHKNGLTDHGPVKLVELKHFLDQETMECHH